MNTTILNRDFQHPTDGWYQIEVPGEHLNREQGIMQVLDAPAITSIVNRFNADADAYPAQHAGVEFPGMLIDHEHFKHQSDKETVAYGWLMRLENRGGKPFGQIRWTATGKPAIDGGDYRFFSSEYDSKDLQILNRGQKPLRVRPLRLDGLTLTNDPNNKGGKPITNRQGAGSQCPDCGCQGVACDEPGMLRCPDCKKNFAVSREPADSTANQNIKNKKMKTVCTLLGLSAEADEASVHEAVTKLKNRVTELEPLATENTTLKNRLTATESEAVDALLAEHGIKEPKMINRLKPALVPLANREERVAYLTDLGHQPGESKPAGKSQTLLNRQDGGNGKPAAAADEAAQVQKAESEIQTYKLQNRCSYSVARNAVRAAKPELFGLTQ